MLAPRIRVSDYGSSPAHPDMSGNFQKASPPGYDLDTFLQDHRSEELPYETPSNYLPADPGLSEGFAERSSLPPQPDVSALPSPAVHRMRRLGSTPVYSPPELGHGGMPFPFRLVGGSSSEGSGERSSPQYQPNVSPHPLSVQASTAHHNINPTCLLILYQSKPSRRLHLQIASLITAHHNLEAARLLKPRQVVKGSLLRQVYVRTWNTAVQHSKRESARVAPRLARGIPAHRGSITTESRSIAMEAKAQYQAKQHVVPGAASLHTGGT